MTKLFQTTFHVIFLLCECSMISSLFTGNDSDRLSLLSFKNQILDDPLQVFSSWNDSIHFCQWLGITCGHKHQRVTVLDLPSKNLVGTISPSISNLTFLKVINLGFNNFYGKIPDEIGGLFRLQHLNLTNNMIEGEIPINLTRCSELEAIHLTYNKLTGKIPDEIDSLKKLVTLNLGVNNLTGVISPSLGNLSSLLELSLLRNNLEGKIPDDIGRMMRLRFLQVGVNNLSGTIPNSLYNLSFIYYFAVASNQLQGNLPSNIGLTLPNLQSLLVGLNRFTGPIPVSLSNASLLEQFDCLGNNFTGPVPGNLGSLKSILLLNLASNHLGDGLNFLSHLTNCTRLMILALENNLFGGILPDSIANLSTQLKILSLGGNQIRGSIPLGIGNLVKLKFFTLDVNLLTDNIPVNICKLHRMQRLFLDQNKLSGQIPSCLGNMTELFEFHLEENNLEGSIPPSLGSCKQLQLLNLSYNNLTGTVPAQVFSLSSLSISLNLAHNSLTGSIPLEVGNLINLAELDLSENMLSGELPQALGDCLKLEHLYMQSNMFHGGIPSSLSSLKAIQGLDLSRNNLSGPIPAYVENLPLLQNLNLSFNNFEGEVPSKRVFINASAVSISGNSKLCGGIPEFHLHSCAVQESKTEKRGMSLAVKLIISIASLSVCSTLMLFLLTLYCRIRKLRKNNPSASAYATPSIIEHMYPKISYEELLKATEGFSPVNLIGSGTFGTVYKGIILSPSDETIVAVKVLNLQQQGAVKSFVAECDAIRNIRHRNLVKVLTACSSSDFEGNDFKAIVYTYLPNGSLEKWLHLEDHGRNSLSRKLNLVQRMDIAIDVASALHYLHHECQTPIVHCDLKPSNVLLDDDMNGHVSDFGLARLISDSATHYSHNQFSSIGVKGSIGYAAPEYGMGGQVSTQGDVYSYGILLLEMFTRRRPTDELFIEGLNLHNFAKMALSERRVMEIVDPSFTSLEEANVVDKANNIEYLSDWRHRISEILTSIIRIGVSCSAESPRERVDMAEVMKQTHMIRNTFLKEVRFMEGERTIAQLAGEGTSRTN